MKKLKGIFICILLLIGLCSNASYADVIVKDIDIKNDKIEQYVKDQENDNSINYLAASAIVASISVIVFAVVKTKKKTKHKKENE